MPRATCPRAPAAVLALPRHHLGKVLDGGLLHGLDHWRQRIGQHECLQRLLSARVSREPVSLEQQRAILDAKVRKDSVRGPLTLGAAHAEPEHVLVRR